MSKTERIFVTPVENTIYYGDVRRRPAEYEEQHDGTMVLKRKSDIFMLREFTGKDKNNKKVVVTVAEQLKSFGDNVRIIDVNASDIHRVKAAKLEMDRIDNFAREQAELDEISLAEKIANAKEQGLSADEITQSAIDKSGVADVDQAALDADIAESTAVKSQAELDAEEAAKVAAEGGDPVIEPTPEVVAPVVAPVVETPVVETPEVITPVVETPVVETPQVETPAPAANAGDSEGTGSREVI